MDRSTETEQQHRCAVFMLTPPPLSTAAEQRAWDSMRRPEYELEDNAVLPADPTATESGDGVQESSVDFGDELAEGMPTLHIDTDTDSVVSESELLTPITHEGTLPDEPSERRKSAEGSPSDYDGGRSRAQTSSGSIQSAASGRYHPQFCTTQGYLLVLEVSDGTDSVKTPLKLLVDTGSRLTWVYNEDLARLEPDGRRVRLTVEQNPEDDLQVGPETYHTRLYVPDLDCMASDATLRRIGPKASIEYNDDCRAEGVMLKDGRKCTIVCFDWRSNSRYELDVIVYLAATFAANFELLKDPSEGILALGPSIFQDHIELLVGETRYPSFMVSLTKHLQGGAGMRREDYSLYLSIRPHPLYRRGEQTTSWLAFNEWPFSLKPPFSDLIYLHQDAYSTRGERWLIRLLRIEFLRSAHDHFNEVDISFGPGGLKIHLDSGCSTSRLPRAVIEKIHHKMFGNERQLSSDTFNRTTYTVPQGISLDMGQIRYTFASNAPQAPNSEVVVCGPMNHFVFTKELNREGNPVTGLIYVGEDDYGVFGLNFMQTMYLSLHKGNAGLDWVRMAAQWPHESGSYHLVI
ncbi:hypothetical protein C8T65DRAFT_696722 [Cerioporus squamosus]|nr:hypothetical protein C8T65DRAFT_696722 [Cerioporus squamosus]